MSSPSLQLDLEKALKGYIGSVRVSGAGTPSANGWYTDRGYLLGNDRRTYNLAGSPNMTSANSIFYHSTTKWSIYNEDGRVYKQVPGDFANPWDVTAWVTDADGAAPVPVVTTVLPGYTLHAAHETDKELTGNYLVIVADPPDWEDYITNAVVPTRFELYTSVKDPTTRGAATAAHSSRLGKLIELFSDQNFEIVRAELNIPATGIDTRPWAGLGFSGWEALKPEPDIPGDKEIVSRLPYDFIVFLES